MAGDRRAGGAEYAARVNAAADLLDAGMAEAEAARVLAGRLGCSPRQARRYADQAAARGRVPVPEAAVVFTVKVPARLAAESPFTTSAATCSFRPSTSSPRARARFR